MENNPLVISYRFFLAFKPSHFVHMLSFRTYAIISSYYILLCFVMSFPECYFLGYPWGKIVSYIYLKKNSYLECVKNSFPVLAAAAAATKSLQSCPTLCNPIDGSPPGSPVPGILQAFPNLLPPLPSGLSFFFLAITNIQYTT